MGSESLEVKMLQKSVGEILISKFAEQRIRIKKMISENLKQYEMVQQE